MNPSRKAEYEPRTRPSRAVGVPWNAVEIKHAMGTSPVLLFIFMFERAMGGAGWRRFFGVQMRRRRVDIENRDSPFLRFESSCQ